MLPDIIQFHQSPQSQFACLISYIHHKFLCSKSQELQEELMSPKEKLQQP